MVKKYKAWGNFKCQTVRPGKKDANGRPAKIVVREGDSFITVGRGEIPSLIQALLEIGALK